MSSLRFHKDIYPKQALAKAVKAYASLCRCSISDHAGHYLLSLEPTKACPDPALLDDEISNYILAESVPRT